VLLLGETGTGKEVIARAILNVSSRSNLPFVKLNCAAIPSGLLESELFGHEKGAFTGAVSQKIGRFELANGGTLFLDEVGDIPLELQPKLLRVLQEQEFERLGNSRTVRVDVRLIAATNRDLEQMVAEKQFREDLYFRLNVFPIRIPPLRERSEDISLLVQYYVDKYSERMNKQIDVVPEETMAALCRYSWPGNIRELQNLIERAVIMTPGNVLQIRTNDLQQSNPILSTMAGTLEDVERQRILQALQEAGAVIGGPHGAAVRLGLKRTTLLSKMQKLGIARNTNYSPLTQKEESKDLPQPVKR
jgi:formate hydrogenlyase transcriptional activator